LVRMWRKGHLCTLLVGKWMCTIIVENYEIPWKTKNRITISFRNPISGCLAKIIEIIVLKRCLHSYVYCSTIHNSQVMKST
jgi:hypothetical protein